MISAKFIVHEFSLMYKVLKQTSDYKNNGRKISFKAKI